MAEVGHAQNVANVHVVEHAGQLRARNVSERMVEAIDRGEEQTLLDAHLAFDERNDTGRAKTRLGLEPLPLPASAAPWAT